MLHEELAILCYSYEWIKKFSLFIIRSIK